jgi:hypothetical protein
MSFAEKAAGAMGETKHHPDRAHRWPRQRGCGGRKRRSAVCCGDEVFRFRIVVVGLNGGGSVERRCALLYLEQRPCLSAVELYRAGALTPNVRTDLAWPDHSATTQAERDRLLLAIEVGDDVKTQIIAIERVAGEGGDLVFLACPECSRKRRSLFANEAGKFICRECGRWDYASRHKPGEPAWAAMRLRKRLGCTGPLFSSLPPRPADRAGAKAYDAFIVQIRAYEALAYKQLRAHNDGLEGYLKRRGHL